jgi:hypothetical protein
MLKEVYRYLLVPVLSAEVWNRVLGNKNALVGIAFVSEAEMAKKHIM